MASDEKGKGAAHPSSKELRRSRTIRAGDNLLIKLPSGAVKQIHNVQKNTAINLGKYGSCQAGDLLGQPFGLTYDIEGGKLRAMLNGTASDLFEGSVDDIEATNQHIREKAGAQKLTFLDIETLKKEGVSGRAIIQKQIAEHSAFEQKSEFSKEKYIKRKESKYLKMFTVLEPTIHTVVQYHFENNPQPVRGLRPDTVSQILCHANVRPGWRGIVIDEVGGLLTGSILDKLGGEGTCLLINDADSPPDTHLLAPFNFPDSTTLPLKSLNWAQADPSWSAGTEAPSTTAPKRDNGAATGTRLPKEAVRQKKKRAKHEELEEVRRNLWQGEFEALIICSQYSAMSIVDRLAPYLSGSSSLVIYSPLLEPLADAQHVLRSSPDFINITLAEPWLRKYQVLPGRTHPEMNGTAGGGYILTAIRVLGLPEGASIPEATNKRKRDA